MLFSTHDMCLISFWRFSDAIRKAAFSRSHFSSLRYYLTSWRGLVPFLRYPFTFSVFYIAQLCLCARLIDCIVRTHQHVVIVLARLVAVVHISKVYTPGFVPAFLIFEREYGLVANNMLRYCHASRLRVPHPIHPLTMA